MKHTWCLSTEEWIQKIGFIYTIKQYQGTKKRKFHEFYNKLMELENQLSVVIQTQMDMHGMYALISV